MNTTNLPAFAAASLHAEVRAIDTDNPGWHSWISDAGVIHSTSCRCETPEGSGTTLTAGTPLMMRTVIAETEHFWHMNGVAA
jgi:hypothetical protein